MLRLFYLGVFGLVGIYSRYFLDHFLQGSYGQPHYLSTMIVNLLGSFLVGIVFVFSVERLMLSQDFRIAIIVGLLGGFTTFSAFSLDAMRLINAQRVGMLMTYVGVSVFGGILCCFLGMILTKRILAL